jgi:hypothetical protein
MTYKNALIDNECKNLYCKRIVGGDLDKIEEIEEDKEQEPLLEPLEIKHFIKNSYGDKLEDYKDFDIDEDLSGQRVQVYHNPNTNQTVIVHRGTNSKHDIIHDLQLGLLHSTNNARFKHAEKIQKLAEDKYGTNNLITLGHSLGANYASKIGKKSKQIITLNSAVIPSDVIFNTVPKNQIDYRSSVDLVSILRPLQRGRKPITIRPKGFNLLNEHKSRILNRI